MALLSVMADGEQSKNLLQISYHPLQGAEGHAAAGNYDMEKQVVVS